MRDSKGIILIVEDDKYQRGIIRTILLKEGYYVEDVDTAKKAIELIRTTPFDIILTDLRLPDMEGTAILKEAKALNSFCHVIIITAYGSIPSAIEATKLGAFYYLEKPLEKEQLLLMINNAMNQVALMKDNIMLKDQLLDRFHIDNIVGNHGRMQELFKIVKKVAPTNTTVLIYGESGTGKELFAKSIHFNSPRRNRPFFAINCAAIPETLLESELFGYEKGAFTGALSRHAGLFEQANNSTLFLDEIGDLTLSTQSKLLRVLQEREIRRIGGKDTVRLDVRIIAATNKKLEEEIANGRFREDLYYRLDVIAFTIPSLRERATDIPLLAEHFLKLLNDSNGSKKTITKEAIGLLMRYGWPGNVRQLQSVLERAYIMSDPDTIGTEHIPEEVKQGNIAVSQNGLALSLTDYLIDARLTAAEYRLYLYFLSLESRGQTQGHVQEPGYIMKKLDITKQTFYTGISRLKELGLYDYRSRSKQ